MREGELTGKRALLAGTLHPTLIAVGKALHQAGAAVVVAEDSALWGDLPYTLDVADAAPEIVVINAGWRHYAPFLNHSPADWDAALQANFETPLFNAQSAAKRMIAQQQAGCILFLSGFESLMPYELTAATGTSLTMLAGLARMMAVDLAAHGISVNVLTAGWVDAAPYTELDAASQHHIVAGIPFGRVAQPQEIGAAAVFLASGLARYITGVVLPVDGGYGLTRASGRTLLEGD